jgi:hypothetical protein
VLQKGDKAKMVKREKEKINRLEKRQDPPQKENKLNTKTPLNPKLYQTDLIKNIKLLKQCHFLKMQINRA